MMSPFGLFFFLHHHEHFAGITFHKVLDGSFLSL
jgi:hypothetical protein